jgi:hypothetical protein
MSLAIEFCHEHLPDPRLLRSHRPDLTACPEMYLTPVLPIQEVLTEVPRSCVHSIRQVLG